MEPSTQTLQRGKWRKLFAYMIMLFGGAAAITYLIINLLNVVVTYSLNEPAELKQVTAREAAAAFGITHNREYPLSFVSSTDEMKRAATSDDAMFFIGDTESLANRQEKYLTFWLVKDGMPLSWDVPRGKLQNNMTQQTTDAPVLSVYFDDRRLKDVVWELAERGLCGIEFSRGLLRYTCQPSRYELQVSSHPGEASPFYGVAVPDLYNFMRGELGGDGGATVRIGPPRR